MLLFIALANAAGVALGGPGIAAQPAGAERAANLLLAALVHARAYPVFAVMFGYGVVQLAGRLEEGGAPPADVRAVLLRRNAALVAFGCLHALLLYFGDFLAAYGLAGMIATMALLRRGERVHRVVLWMWAASLGYAVVLAAQVAWRLADPGGPPAPLPAGTVGSLVAPDYATAMRARLEEWPRHTLTVLPFITIVWLGMWAARRRLLEEPARHVALLRRVAAAGLGLAIAGGAPFALASARLVDADARALDAMFLLHQVSGMFGGPGYVALFGLAAPAVARPPVAAWTRPVAALGRRSLSGYLFQSLAWLLLLSPYTLALGRRFPSPLLTALAVALLVWVASLLAADALERRSRPGPAERFLGRVAYGPRREPATGS
jgi:uncharacterized membrane protein YeiB